VVVSDNGGEAGVGGLGAAYAQNLPYRGVKSTSFEGGIHVPGFLTGGAVPTLSAGQHFTGVVHVSDWLPTFLGAAGRTDLIPFDLDGLNQWPNFQANSGGRRETVNLFYENDQLGYAITYLRQYEWKLVLNGSRKSGSTDLENTEWQDYAGLEVRTQGDYEAVMLFNIDNDPWETTNLASAEPTRVATMMARLEFLRQDQYDYTPLATTKAYTAAMVRGFTQVRFNDGTYGFYLGTDTYEEFKYLDEDPAYAGVTYDDLAQPLLDVPLHWDLQPNIVYFMWDDLGSTDVGYLNGDFPGHVDDGDFATPKITAYANAGGCRPPPLPLSPARDRVALRGQG